MISLVSQEDRDRYSRMSDDDLRTARSKLLTEAALLKAKADAIRGEQGYRFACRMDAQAEAAYQKVRTAGDPLTLRAWWAAREA